MSHAPRLLAGQRRGLAAVLCALALGEALLAVLFAATLDRLMAQAGPPLLPLLAACGFALIAGAALLLQRWVGEIFAQGFVTDCRTALFRAVTCHAGKGGDARWLTVLINDLNALRNYALRGTVRLWTSVTAAGAAAAWVALTMPHLRAGLAPLLIGAGAITLMIWPLSHAITAQRAERGRLNRFLVRRVRAELATKPVTNGHGFRRLADLSSGLAQAAIRRAARAGALDAIATLAGLAATLIIVWQSVRGQGTAGLAGGLMLFGFIAARLLESARALHARIGGRIALDRLEERLTRAGGQAPRTARTRQTVRSRAARAAQPRPPHAHPLAQAQSRSPESRP